MATQICPNCKEDSFTWNMDDKNPSLTFWGCHLCRYGAYENEKENKTFRHKCSKCSSLGSMKLEDNLKIYAWCYNCNSYDILNEKNQMKKNK